MGGGSGDGETVGETLGLAEFRGSGALVATRPEPGGTPIAELPALEGELTLYLGGGEGGLYVDIIDRLERIYPDFSVQPKMDSSASLANLIVTEMEGGSSPADVFLSIDAGSLGVVADAGGTTALPESVTEQVPEAYRSPDGQWVGLEGRARTIPYNTEALTASEIPDSVMALPDTDVAGEMGWAPTYGAFQAFVTAMRLTEGEDATREWLQGMLDAGVEEYPNEFVVSNTVADGALSAGFANHYYALRVRNARPGVPLDLAFTSGDAGALVNVSGASVIESSDRQEMAANFVRHMLSAEVQEFFATVTFGYPMIPEVAPAGGLPTIEELDPPDLNLTELSDLQPTLDLMREVGVL
jgi:iron(III) transport system substrate-binding protein